MSSGSTPIKDSRRLLHFFRIGLGVVFAIAGIIGLLLPVVPQTIFFVLAVILLFPDHPRVKKLLDRLEPKYPRLINFFERLGIGDDEPEEPVRHLSPPLCMETKDPAIQYEFRRLPELQSEERQEIR